MRFEKLLSLCLSYCNLKSLILSEISIHSNLSSFVTKAFPLPYVLGMVRAVRCWLWQSGK